MYNNLSDAQLVAILNDPKIVLVLAALSIWAIIWKGLALWKAARNDHNAWYIVMLLANTLGILEIIYIFFFSKKKDKSQQ